MFGILWPEGTVNEMQAVYELKHNPSMNISTTAANAVGDLSTGTKNAFGATTRALEASTKAIGGSMSKTLATMKIATSLRRSANLRRRMWERWINLTRRGEDQWKGGQSDWSSKTYGC